MSDETAAPAETPQRPAAHPWGVGMPAFLALHEFGSLIRQAFGHEPVLVGSALVEKRLPRDIDVRLELDHATYRAFVGPEQEFGQPGTRWAALTRAFAALGRDMTGLPIDFQPQPPGVWNRYLREGQIHLGYSVAYALAYQPRLTPPADAPVTWTPLASRVTGSGSADAYRGHLTTTISNQSVRLDEVTAPSGRPAPREGDPGDETDHAQRAPGGEAPPLGQFLAEAQAAAAAGRDSGVLNQPGAAARLARRLPKHRGG